MKPHFIKIEAPPDVAASFAKFLRKRKEADELMQWLDARLREALLATLKLRMEIVDETRP